MHLPDDIRAAMVAHARFCFPFEACGLLAADADGRLRMVYALTNAQRSSVAYTVDPAEHVKAWRHAERNGWRLAGVFHSHPHTDAFPSKTDVVQALEPEWLHVIVSLRDEGDPEVRGYWLRDGTVREEVLDGGHIVPGVVA